MNIGLLGSGDMGHAVGRALQAHGHHVVTCLAGRSARSRELAQAADLAEVADLEALVSGADLVLSIVPPAVALEVAAAVAEAMTRVGATPPFADCNAVSPATARAIAEVIAAAGAPFIDAGIVGSPPGKGDPPRFYVSGADTAPMEALDGQGLAVKPLGAEVGRASALKMCYAGLTKGTFTLHTAVLMAARALGLAEELGAELRVSQGAVYGRMEAMVPRLAADAERWIGEMEEIAATFESAGLPRGFHDGASEIFRLLAATPLAAETRETLDPDRTLDEAVAIFAAALDRQRR
jgi:3-hydroxyisobutyrate dehydrogenase-like beta-hydroxyacid dehydrogenase